MVNALFLLSSFLFEGGTESHSHSFRVKRYAAPWSRAMRAERVVPPVPRVPAGAIRAARD